MVLLVSAWTKAVDPHGFAAQIAREGLLSASLASPVALLVVAVEAAVGLSLLLLVLRVPVLLIATAMMLGFWLLAGWQYLYPPDDPSSCGCFGNLVQQSPGQHLLANTLFVALSLLAWRAKRRGPMAAAQKAIPLLGLIAAALFTASAPRLPIDDWPGVTRLVPGAQVSELKIDEVIPELQDGTQLVLLIDRADEKTRAEISRVNEQLALPLTEVEVFGLAEDDEELEAEFFWTAGPAFDVRGAPYGLLKPLYRSMPRAFLVQSGRIEHVWNEIPDEATLSQIAEGRLPGRGGRSSRDGSSPPRSRRCSPR
ncbi:MAG: hypothetical protein JSV80_14740 [Acidobacteriota bacterium]|nr:MAG: hypothetical protein JSV80_14740 [Acidobacteriota bacterium]